MLMVVSAALLVPMVQSNSARASIVVTTSFYAGSRTTLGTSSPAGGLAWNPADGNWSDGKFKIEWGIVDNGSDFTYSYTVTTPDNGKLSHWILELSPKDNNGESLEADWNLVFPGDEVGLTGSQSGNPGMPDVDDGDVSTDADKDDIWGVRFEASGTVTTVTFTTSQVPVWGDFYAKDGGGKHDPVYAYNVGFGTDPSGSETAFTNWIPRPDGQPGGGGGGAIPEPASIVVWSLIAGGAAGLASLRKRRSDSSSRWSDDRREAIFAVIEGKAGP